MDIKKLDIDGLSVIFAIAVSGLEEITKDMTSRDKSMVYELFIANIRGTLAIDTSDRKIFDYES